MNDQQKLALQSLCRDVEAAIKRNDEQYTPQVLADFREQFAQRVDARAKTQCCNRWLALYKRGG